VTVLLIEHTNIFLQVLSDPIRDLIFFNIFNVLFVLGVGVKVLAAREQQWAASV